jgi:hypothetical protein
LFELGSLRNECKFATLLTPPPLPTPPTPLVLLRGESTVSPAAIVAEEDGAADGAGAANAT